MQIITGDETGLVKLIDLEKKEVVKKYGEQGQEYKIIQILTLKLSDINFYLILREQSIVLLDSDLNEMCQQTIDESPIKFFCDSNYNIYIVYNNRKINLIQYDEQENVFTSQQTLNKEDFAFLLNLKDKYVTSAAISNDQKLLLITYFGAPPSIFDLKQRKLYWQARNVKNDELDLQVKMYDFDGLFLDDYSIGVVTVHQTLRVYNILQNKSQPISEHSLKHSKTKVKFIKLYNEKYFMANERGEILIYQKDFKFERAIKGTFGAIRDITVNKEYVYTVSVDRFLRVYHIENVRIPLSINLSQRLTSINFSNQEYKEIEIEEQEKKIWNIKNGKEAKARFAGMRKHTIKLNYLEKMFENHKLNKNKKQQEKIKQEQIENGQQDIKQEYEETYEPNRNGIENKKIKKLTQKKKILDLKKKKLLVNKPRNKTK